MFVSALCSRQQDSDCCLLGSNATPLALQDRALCSHVLTVHQTGKAPERTDAVELLDAATLRAYIAKAKQFSPYVHEDLAGRLVENAQCAARFDPQLMQLAARLKFCPAMSDKHILITPPAPVCEPWPKTLC